MTMLRHWKGSPKSINEKTILTCENEAEILLRLSVLIIIILSKVYYYYLLGLYTVPPPHA